MDQPIERIGQFSSQRHCGFLCRQLCSFGLAPLRWICSQQKHLFRFIFSCWHGLRLRKRLHHLQSPRFAGTHCFWIGQHGRYGCKQINHYRRHQFQQHFGRHRRISKHHIVHHQSTSTQPHLHRNPSNNLI